MNNKLILLLILIISISNLSAQKYGHIWSDIPEVNYNTSAELQRVGEIGTVSKRYSLAASLYQNPSILSKGNDLFQFSYSSVEIPETYIPENYNEFNFAFKPTKSLSFGFRRFNYIGKKFSFSPNSGKEWSATKECIENSLIISLKISPRFSTGFSFGNTHREEGSLGGSDLIRYQNGNTFDLGFNYDNYLRDSSLLNYQIGFSITNTGPRVKNSSNRDGYDDTRPGYLPSSIQLGSVISKSIINVKKIAVDVNFYSQFSKAIIPTYNFDQMYYDSLKYNEYHYQSSFDAIVMSFSDAPRGRKEEFEEINIQKALELEFKKNDFLFTTAISYFKQNRYKGRGNRISVGSTIGYKYIYLSAAVPLFLDIEEYDSGIAEITIKAPLDLIKKKSKNS